MVVESVISRLEGLGIYNFRSTKIYKLSNNLRIMPSCKNCGAYTKYFNGLCYSCYNSKKSKAGKVYMGEVTFGNGSKKIYTGQTRRSVYQRAGEHMADQRSGNTRTYTGRGTRFKLLGSIFSRNRFKAERTVKSLPREEKIGLARYGARRFRRWFS
jgi:predicted GIY-YIG superfamily endonuclease